MTDTTKETASTGWQRQTQAVRGGLLRSEFCETSEAIYMTSGYVYGAAEEAEASFKGDADRYVYSRYANPTVAMFEERARILEGAEAARGTGSGMAAVFSSLMCQVAAGDRVVSSRALFGSCEYIIGTLLPRYGVEVEFVDGTDPNQWEKALSRPAKAVFLETPSNPTLEIVDLKLVTELAHRAGASVVIDNVFATPCLQHPLALGADVVVYSATKHIDGQGRCLGGLVLGSKSFVEDHLAPFLKHTGPAMSPFNAWILLKGLETLELRVERQMRSADQLARFLEGRPGVAQVRYPGLPSHPQHNLALTQMSGGGTLVAFELAGGKRAAFSCLNALKIVDISNNLGDSKSLVTHPATTTHQRLSEEAREALGIRDGLLRLSVGLEHVDDLEADLDQAITACA